MTGKERCEFMRRIRKYVAEKNKLKYEPQECTFEGECLGYCPICDAEAADLLQQLEKKGELSDKDIIDPVSVDELKKIIEILELSSTPEEWDYEQTAGYPATRDDDY